MTLRPTPGEFAPDELVLALERLAGGEGGVRLPVVGDGDGARMARAFNVLAERAARGGGTALQASSGAGADGGVVSHVVILTFRGLIRLRQHLGGSIADQILRATAERVAARLPQVRFGRSGRTNMEFGFQAADDAQALAQLSALVPTLEARLELEGQSFDLDVAMGFADRAACGDAALDCAALALNDAQADHAKVVGFRPQDQEATAQRLSLLYDLRQAILRDELHLVYQPKYRTRSQTTDEVEALLRWTHPARGPVSPDIFIELAEETGLIEDLTRWVMERAMADQAALAQAGHEMAISVNLSGRLVADRAFCDWAVERLGQSDGSIGFEITETAMIADPDGALINLHAFADAGIRLAIDDYGSGFSSMAYLKRLPAHELKIDKMFIAGLTSSHRDPQLVRSSIELAHALGMEVTAEGVEDQMTLSLLKLMGCDLIQGYLISKPLALGDLIAFCDAGVKVDVAPTPFAAFAVKAAS